MYQVLCGAQAPVTWVLVSVSQMENQGREREGDRWTGSRQGEMREGSAVAGPALTAPGALGVTTPPAQLTHFSPKQQRGLGAQGCSETHSFTFA